MNDRISRYRSSRLSIYWPVQAGGQARWALLATTVKNGIPGGHIIADGVLPSQSAYPAEWEVWEAIDLIAGQYLPR